MPIATKNNSIIVKDGSVAENCDCCATGWYCYRNPCETTVAGADSLWTCGESEWPPDTITVNVTFSGQKWCEWIPGAGDANSLVNYFSRTYDASSSLSTTITLFRRPASFLFPSGVIGSLPLYGLAASCVYVDSGWVSFTPNPVVGVNHLAIVPATRAGVNWECALAVQPLIPIKQYDSTERVPQSVFESTRPACSVSTDGVEGLGLGSYTADGGSIGFLHKSDTGPYTSTNPTLGGITWTLSHLGRPICAIEVVQP